MLLGPSAAMSALWSQARRLAPHARTVLLTGDPDCGQEAVARLLLDLSAHPQRPFVTLGEGDAEDRLSRPHGPQSLPPELFLFVPQVHRLSPVAQAGLLRLLRTRRTRALSVVAATGEDLRALVGLGRFSAELAEILTAVRIVTPPLKERLEDIPMLLAQMLASRCQGQRRPVPQLSEELLRAAMRHEWHGNLRELSEVAKLLLLEEVAGEELRASHLFRAFGALQRPEEISSGDVRLVKLDTVVQEHICAVLRSCRGNKLRAAEVLGISRSTLYRMLDAAAQNTSLPLAS